MQQGGFVEVVWILTWPSVGYSRPDWLLAPDGTASQPPNGGNPDGIRCWAALLFYLAAPSPVTWLALVPRLLRSTWSGTSATSSSSSIVKRGAVRMARRQARMAPPLLVTRMRWRRMRRWGE